MHWTWARMHWCSFPARRGPVLFPGMALADDAVVVMQQCHQSVMMRKCDGAPKAVQHVLGSLKRFLSWQEFHSTGTGQASRALSQVQGQGIYMPESRR